MTVKITETEGQPLPKWKVGLRIWRTDGMWRLRFYQPWQKRVKFAQVESKNFLVALYMLGIALKWWEHKS
jgi:hypothetical protein